MEIVKMSLNISPKEDLLVRNSATQLIMLLESLLLYPRLRVKGSLVMLHNKVNNQSVSSIREARR